MRNSRLVVATIALLWNFQGNAQTCMTMLKDQLVAELNEKVAPAFQLTIEKDTGVVKLLKLKQNMPLIRSPKKGSFFESLSKKPGPYHGPIYWIYDFEKIRTPTAIFKKDTTNIVVLEIQLKTADSVVINAKKNAFSYVHRIIDVKLHQVIWSGEKSLRIEFNPVKEINQILLEVQKVTIQGFF